MAVTTAPRGARTPASAVSVAGKTLADFPDIAAQLHPDLNGGLTAGEISGGSSKKRWWICAAESEHVWEAVVANRTRLGRACPFCSGQKVSPTNSLAVLHPDIAAQLDPDRNGGVTANEIVAGSNARYWWICERGSDHRWEAKLAHRTGSGSGCPFCSGHQVSVTNSLATLFPTVSAQLDPHLNGGLTADRLVAGSDRRVWWRCVAAPDHVWETTVKSRTRLGTGCPACSGRQASAANSLASRFPAIAAQLDPERNDGVTADRIAAGSSTKYWWRCGKGPDHMWETTAASRTSGGTGCPACSGRQASAANSLASRFPAIAAQLDPERNDGVTADRIAAGSDQKYWWICDKGPDHVWYAPASRRSGGSGCPFCSGHQVSVTNSLATLFPTVSAQLDPHLNGGLTADRLVAGSDRRVWWRCAVAPDHVWETTVTNRTRRGHGCPHCSVAGRSKFEMQVAAILRSSTGLSVTLDVKVNLPGQVPLGAVDLEIPEVGFLVDLDPAYWHQNAERDQRKLNLLAGRDSRTYVRVREIGAPLLRGNVVEAKYCPEAFADALRPFLEALTPWRELDPSEVAAALADADAEWSELLALTNGQFAKAA